MAKYQPEEGIFGNITRLFSELTNANNMIFSNKISQDCVNTNTEDLLCEVDSTQKLADIEEALIELEELITEANNE